MSVWKLKDRNRYIVTTTEAKNAKNEQAKETALQRYEPSSDFAQFPKLTTQDLKYVTHLPFNLARKLDGIHTKEDLKRYLIELRENFEKELIGMTPAFNRLENAKIKLIDMADALWRIEHNERDS